MEKLTPEQLREKYLSLPRDLRDAIFSVDSADIIQAIGKKYNLMVDKVGELADETGLVMLGITHPKDFISNLAKRLETDATTARKIADEINTQIFKKVRDSLKNVHKIDSETEPEKTSDIKENEVKKEDLLKEIEKTHLPEEEPKTPEVLKETSEPREISPFEEKMKQDISRIASEESEHKEEGERAEEKYPSGDPYKEQI